MKQPEEKLSFETNLDDNNVVITRKFIKKHLTKKEAEDKKNNQTTVKLHLFDESDLKNLQQLAAEINDTVVLKSEDSAMKSVLRSAVEFFTK